MLGALQSLLLVSGTVQLPPELEDPVPNFAATESSAHVIIPDGHDAEVLALLEPFVFDWVHARRGSISAEHGVGQCKFAYLPKTKPAPVMDLMRRTKALFDPNGILNPYKVL